MVIIVLLLNLMRHPHDAAQARLVGK